MKRSKSLSVLLALSMILTAVAALPLNQTRAAGVAVTVSAPANGEFAALTATDVTFHYVASATQYASGDVITVSISPAVAAAVTDCTSATTDIDGDLTVDGSFGSFTTTDAVYTLTAATTVATTTGVDLCLRFPASTTTGIYSISFSDTNDGDYGSALVYVGDDNDVNVTADVSTVLSFAIRNSADTADTNACALGTLSVASVKTCSYRLKPITNNSTGYTVNVTSNGDLSKNGTGDVADADDIDPIAENSTVSAGTEGYGLLFNAGASSKAGVTISEAGDFSDDDTPVPTASTLMYSSDGLNNPGVTDTTNTALVTHRATMDADTETGNYAQTVTYYAALAF